MDDFDGASGDIMSIEECAVEIGRLLDENVKLRKIKKAAQAVVDSGILYKYLELSLKAALEGVE